MRYQHLFSLFIYVILSDVLFASEMAIDVKDLAASTGTRTCTQQIHATTVGVCIVSRGQTLSYASTIAQPLHALHNSRSEGKGLATRDWCIQCVCCAKNSP